MSLSYFSVSPGDIQLHAQRYRALRLEGLQLSPESFSSTYEAESRLTTQDWISRLTKPGFRTFICAAGADPADADAPWVAQLTVRGPIPHEEFELPAESGQPVQSREEAACEERWQFLALYVHPQWRGKRIAQDICKHAISALETDRLGAGAAVERLRLRAIVKPDNVASRLLFIDRLGFQDSGRSTLAEALRANGEALPAGWKDNEKYTRRGGWILTKLVSSRRSPAA